MHSGHECEPWKINQMDPAEGDEYCIVWHTTHTSPHKPEVTG